MTAESTISSFGISNGKKLAQWSDDQPVNQTPGYVIINPFERAEFVGNVSTRDMVAGRTYTLEATVVGYDKMRQVIQLSAKRRTGGRIAAAFTRRSAPSTPVAHKAKVRTSADRAISSARGSLERRSTEISVHVHESETADLSSTDDRKRRARSSLIPSNVNVGLPAGSYLPPSQSDLVVNSSSQV